MINNEQIIDNDTQLLSVSELVVDKEYQRVLNKKRVDRIVNEFNKRQFGYIKVSPRDGKYYVIDGQHRLTAAKILGFKKLSCQVCEGLNQKTEADDFLHQQENMSRIHTRDKFRSALVAEDEESLAIAKIVKKNGFELLGFGIDAKNPSCISSIGTLQRIVRNSPDGFKILDVALYLARLTWGNQSKSALGFVLSGTAAFVRRFVGENFNYENFVKQLAGELTTIVANYEAEKYDRHITSYNRLDRLFSNLLAKQYNKGLASRSKQRLMWEEQ